MDRVGGDTSRIESPESKIDSKQLLTFCCSKFAQVLQCKSPRFFIHSIPVVAKLLGSLSLLKTRQIDGRFTYTVWEFWGILKKWSFAIQLYRPVVA